MESSRSACEFLGLRGACCFSPPRSGVPAGRAARRGPSPPFQKGLEPRRSSSAPPRGRFSRDGARVDPFLVPCSVGPETSNAVQSRGPTENRTACAKPAFPNRSLASDMRKFRPITRATSLYSSAAGRRLENRRKGEDMRKGSRPSPSFNDRGLDWPLAALVFGATVAVYAVGIFALYEIVASVF
jgi:hypothetical protein